jgi:hypothetical protein
MQSKVLRKYLNKTLWILFPSPPPHPTPPNAKQEESKREKNEINKSCRGGSTTSAFSLREGHLRVCELVGVFPNLRRMREYWNLSPSINNSLFVSSLFTHFCIKEIFPMGTWEHINFGELPWHKKLHQVSYGKCSHLREVGR